MPTIFNSRHHHGSVVRQIWQETLDAGQPVRIILVHAHTCLHTRLLVSHLYNTQLTNISLKLSYFVFRWFFTFRILGGVFSFGFSLAFTISVEIVSVEFRMILGVLINVSFLWHHQTKFDRFNRYFSGCVCNGWDAGGFVRLSLPGLERQHNGVELRVSGLCCRVDTDARVAKVDQLFLLLKVDLIYLTTCTFRWLLAEGKIDEVKKLLIKGAKMNGKQISEETLDKVDKIKEEMENEPPVSN